MNTTIDQEAQRLGLDPSEHSLAIEFATQVARRIDTFPEAERGRVIREVVGHLESAHPDRKQRVMAVLWPDADGQTAQVQQTYLDNVQV